MQFIFSLRKCAEHIQRLHSIQIYHYRTIWRWRYNQYLLPVAEEIEGTASSWEWNEKYLHQFKWFLYRWDIGVQINVLSQDLLHCCNLYTQQLYQTGAYRLKIEQNCLVWAHLNKTPGESSQPEATIYTRWRKDPHWEKSTAKQGDSSAPVTGNSYKAGKAHTLQGGLTGLPWSSSLEFATSIKFWSMWRILWHTTRNWFFKELYWKKSQHKASGKTTLPHILWVP